MLPMRQSCELLAANVRKLAKATLCGHVENHRFTHYKNAESLYSVCACTIILIIHKWQLSFKRSLYATSKEQYS